MCGIYGMVSLTGAPLKHPDRLHVMGRSLTHRGPDTSRVVEDATAAFGVERLKIIDPREEADQPFVSPDNSSWIACNGEIYNHVSIRNRFTSYRFRSRSDIEPLVPLIEKFGADGLNQIDGMFAMATWNTKTKNLILARDRAGEKPLFYSEIEGEVWFASEVQALLVHPKISRAIDDYALTEYLGLGYVREPRTMFQQIRKIPAGTWCEFSSSNQTFSGQIGAPTWLKTSPSGPPSAARLRSIIADSVSKQLVADVPVGIFLSGGLDSSLLTGLAVRQSSQKLHTFSVAFENRRFDESSWARLASDAFGTHHHEVRVSDGALADACHFVAGAVAEPLADPALLPTWIMAREAKQHVGVALSGEGADELFGGYPTYIGHNLWETGYSVPETARRWMGNVVPRLPDGKGPLGWGLMFDRFLQGSDDIATRHLNWFGPGIFGHLSAAARSSIVQGLPNIPENEAVRYAMALDFGTYLRDNLLVKVDRATMLASLETRAPYLDPAVVLAAGKLPIGAFVSGGRMKPALKAAAAGIVPPKICGRVKRGFSVPVGDLINGPLRGDVDQMLSEDRIHAFGALDDVPVRRWLTEHRNGKRNHGRALWALTMLQLWFTHWGEGV